MCGRQWWWGPPVGVKTCSFDVQVEYRTCPVGKSRNRQLKVTVVAAFAGPATGFSPVPSYSKTLTGWPAQPASTPVVMTLPAMHSTRPLGRRHAGASNARISFPPVPTGKSGPANHAPVLTLYTAVWPVAPAQNTRSSGIRIAGPISIETGAFRTRSAAAGTAPALTHLLVFILYFSAFG